MKYLTKTMLITVNQFAVSLSKDPFVVLNEANLDYLISAIEYKYGDKEEKEQLVLKAAFMLDFIANKAHMFTEGNKRTAISATLLFLALNNTVIKEIGNGELVAFTLSVASGKESVSGIAKWLRERIKEAE